MKIPLLISVILGNILVLTPSLARGATLDHTIFEYLNLKLSQTNLVEYDEQLLQAIFLEVVEDSFSPQNTNSEIIASVTKTLSSLDEQTPIQVNRTSIISDEFAQSSDASREIPEPNFGLFSFTVIGLAMISLSQWGKNFKK